MKFSQHVLFRYESNIDNGTSFLFDIKNYKVFRGRKLEYLILKAIKEGFGREEICNMIAMKIDSKNIQNDVNSFIDFLISNEYVSKN